MAEEDLSLDDPKDTDTEDGENGDSGGAKKKLIIIIAAAVVLLLGGGAAAYFLLFSDGEDTQTPAVVEQTDGEVEGEQETVAKEGTAKAVTEPPKGDAIYISIPDPFLVNIKSGKRTRMMQIKVQLMVRSKQAEDMVKQHMPLLRNDLLDFFSTADANEVQTREGRTALKDGALQTSREVMKAQAGFEAIELVLFTGFVVQ